MSYMNVAEIEAGVAALADAYPETCTLIPLPNASGEGRQSHALRIGPPETPARPASSSSAASTPASGCPPTLLSILRPTCSRLMPLERGCATATRASPPRRSEDLVEGFGIILFPCVNPDGRHYSQTVEPMWRKNRRKVRPDVPLCRGRPQPQLRRALGFPAALRARLRGERLRRSLPSAGLRRPEAASEPETRNVVWLIDQHPATRWFIDVHSYVPAIYHTWGFDENQSSDPDMSFQQPGLRRPTRPGGRRLQRVRAGGRPRRAGRAGQGDERRHRRGGGSPYEFGQSFALYPTSGTSDDYAYTRHFVRGTGTRILGYTSSAAGNSSRRGPTRRK